MSPMEAADRRNRTGRCRQTDRRRNRSDLTPGRRRLAYTRRRAQSLWVAHEGAWQLFRRGDFTGKTNGGRSLSWERRNNGIGTLDGWPIMNSTRHSAETETRLTWVAFWRRKNSNALIPCRRIEWRNFLCILFLQKVHIYIQMTPTSYYETTNYEIYLIK